MYKFRTYPVDHVDDRQSRPLADCPTPFGRFLRRTSIDELPQLFNVIRGDMSIVGPRPERPQFVELLCDEIPGYADRHRVRGGITGLAQVNGYWGQTDLIERVRLDNEYIDQWSLSGDLAILLRTLPAVFRKARY
jgi:putative colanic acid biosynthesis UDP-glucose lipid carrier transferase